MLIDSSVKLNEAEQKLIEYLAKSRSEINRKQNVENKKIGKQSNKETDIEGLGGEFAFCKLFNCYPDTDIQVTSSAQEKDPGDAFLWMNGKKIYVDVKTTKYSTGKLLCPTWKGGNSPINIYVLMIGEFPSYTFKGSILKTDFISKKFLSSFNGNITYKADQTDLLELRECLTRLQNV